METFNYPEVGWMKEKFQVLILNESICEFDWTIEPGASVPHHFHKESEEHFHVLYGELTIIVGEKTIPLKVGEKLIIPKMILHSIKNKSKEKVICRVKFIPSADQDKLFQILFILQKIKPKARNQLLQALYISNRLKFKEFSSFQGGMKYLMFFTMSIMRIISPFTGLNKIASNIEEKIESLG
jgi:quercetin dioxygenase-like cupin family protein